MNKSKLTVLIIVKAHHSKTQKRRILIFKSMKQQNAFERKQKKVVALPSIQEK